MKYFDYLESEDWKILRTAKLGLSGFACEVCKTKSAHPHVHHVLYRTPIETGLVEDLRVMCQRCHNKWHRIERRGRIVLAGDVESRWKKTITLLTSKKARRKHFGRRIKFLQENTCRKNRLGIVRGGEALTGFKQPRLKWLSISEADRHALAIERANGF